MSIIITESFYEGYSLIQPPDPQSWGYLYTDGIAYSVSKYANDIGIHLLTGKRKKSQKPLEYCGFEAFYHSFVSVFF